VFLPAALARAAEDHTSPLRTWLLKSIDSFGKAAARQG